MLNYQRVAGIQIPIMGLLKRLATLVRSLFVHPASGVLPGPGRSHESRHIIQFLAEKNLKHHNPMIWVCLKMWRKTLVYQGLENLPAMVQSRSHVWMGPPVEFA